MKSRWLVPWVLGLATSALLWASFPKLDQGWVSLFALVPWLIVVFSPLRLRLKIGVTAAAFIIFFGFSLAWIRFATWLGFFPLIAYLAVYPVLFCLVISALGSKRLIRSPAARSWLPALAVPVVWTALELVRGHLLTGFPWLLLGHTLHRYPVAQAADIIGSYGLSFLIAAMNSAVAFLVMSTLRISEEKRNGLRLLWQRVYLAVCLLVVVLCWVYGTARLREQTEGAELRVGVVQANAHKDVRKDWSQAPKLLDLHIELSRKLEECDIIVWPETSVPAPVKRRKEMRDKLSALAREKGSYLLIGAFGREGDDNCNSAFFISPSGEFLGRYDKVHLVPFGEYIPLPWLLAPVVRGRVPYKKPFRAGTETDVFRAADVPFSVVICFEDIFPELVGRSVRSGARLLINITSEGWFSTGAELEQHLAIARMNAIAFRVPIVRVANTGISAWIDSFGRVTRSAKLPVDTTGLDVFNVRVP